MRLGQEMCQLQRIRMAPPAARGGAARRRCADFWLNLMFWLSRRAPRAVKALRRLGLWGAWTFSRHLREATVINAGHLLGEKSTYAERCALGRRTLASFFDFIHDIGRTRGMDVKELEAQIAGIEGKEAYAQVRGQKKGAIIATAHMGSFELGLTAMLEVEKQIHVVFQRDPSLFETLRSEFRQRMGVKEAAVDDGWAMWLGLREALSRDEVVAMQADRTMPGQMGLKVPFVDGHALFPEGPAKLAAITGSPIIPVFCIRQADGRVRVFIEGAIWVEGAGEMAIMGATTKLADVVGTYVKRYPEQWLVVQPAWCEDMPELSPEAAGSGAGAKADGQARDCD